MHIHTLYIYIIIFICTGHGGMMDRMDCQLLMMAFTAFHHYHYIAPAPSLSRMEMLIASMTVENQRILLGFVSYIGCFY